MLVFDGCQESSLSAALDVFRVAEAISASRPDAGRTAFEAAFASVDGGVRRTSAGLEVGTEPAETANLDALIAPGVPHRTADDLKAALGALGREAALLAETAAGGKPILAACSGVFLLAAGGALNGRRATTSWWLAPALHAAYPEVVLEAEGRVVADGPCVSAAGVTSNHDLALWLVQHFAGEALRQTCAKFLLLDLDRQSQTPFVIDSLVDRPRGDLMATARAWLNERLTTTIRINELARHCGLSQRTLLRRFRETADRTPARFVQTLRLERAKALLEETELPVAEIAARCGYVDLATFRKTFKLRIRLTPQQYRARFQDARAPVAGAG
jgi:transcriptional regulator GlxA family with amidase domain